MTLLSLIVSGCFSTAVREPSDAQNAENAAFSAKEVALAKCYQRYPETSMEYVAKMNCVLDAHRMTRAYYAYPDLFDQEASYSALVAEKLQAGKMTKAEATAAIMDNHSRQAAEEQRRMNANRTVRAQERTAVAQEDVASAANRPRAPVICNRTGYTVTCF